MTSRLRVCYGKAGRLRFLGHLEVCRALERAIRRAGLPVAHTAGFSPKVRVAYGPALPVGFGGLREYVDVWLDERVDEADAKRRLSAGLPTDMPLHDATFVAPRAPSLSADAAVAMYRVELVGATVEAVVELERGIARLVARGTLTVDLRKGPRTYDLASAFWRPPEVSLGPSLSSAEGAAEGQGGASVLIEEWLRLKDQAPVRPDAVAREVCEGVGDVSFARVVRHECYAERDGLLVPLGEVA